MLQHATNPPQIVPSPSRRSRTNAKALKPASPSAPSMDEMAFAYDKLAAVIMQDHAGMLELGDEAEAALAERLNEIRDRATDIRVSTSTGATFAILLASGLIDRTIYGVDAATRKSAMEDVEKLLYGARDYFRTELERLPSATEYLMPDRCDPRSKKTTTSQAKQPRVDDDTRPTPQAFSVIRADIHPIEADSGHDLLDALCYMKDEDDVAGMLNLYEALAVSAEQLEIAADRVDDRASSLIEAESSRLWAKAYLVADFLKDMRPNEWLVGRYASILHKAAHQMGATFEQAAAVIAEIATWDATRP